MSQADRSAPGIFECGLTHILCPEVVGSVASMVPL